MASSSARGGLPRGQAVAYEPVHQHDEHDPANVDDAMNEQTPPVLPPGASKAEKRWRRATYALAALVVLLLGAVVFLSLPLSFRSRRDGSCPCRPAKDVPQYFQRYPQRWAGPTATGRAAFLAQTRAFDPLAEYVPNEPLETSMPIEGTAEGGESIFRMMGYLSPYAPAPGFGVDEYPLPEGAEIVQLHMVSRHGARYPTSGSDVAALGEKLANASAGGAFRPRGGLAFLREWRYELGGEILVPRGRQELFDSGVLHNYMYGGLYDPSSKIIVRTTTQDRMLKSAENFMAGFFGLDWTNNATIEVIIEQRGFNNSLAGSANCPNSYSKGPGNAARTTWIHEYLKDAQKRFQAMTEGFAWTMEDVYAAQTMCPYETVAYGFSRFCDLFTYREWRDFGYSVDLQFSSISGFHSPTGRALGIGYQQEVVARLRNHTLGYAHSQINTTLDSNTETFPLNQTLYLDFSHDTTIAAILTAFGLGQFAEELPPTRYPGAHNYTISHMTPFGARLDMEIIRTPKPVSAHRDGYLAGGETRYVHLVLNQRTVPLGWSFPECDAERRDGWCELGTFLAVQGRMEARAHFDRACFGDYPAVGYGDVTDGAPP